MKELILDYKQIEKLSFEVNVKKFILWLLDELEITHFEVSLTFSGSDFMSELNNTYRQKAYATDVLSFPLDPTENPEFTDLELESLAYGDIVICPEAVEANALEFKVNPEEEYRRVLVHGILHIIGMDHKTNDRSEPMLIKQEEIMKKWKAGGLF